ncbi:MAG: hypothetical protein FWE36_03005 [Erysipelotrichales bacterium]|nr:hypothetical protein [Erysipelotrichales bacterium]
MKILHKPLFFIGISLFSVGTIAWLIITILNSSNTRNYNHLNNLYPTGVGLLGIVAVIISFILETRISILNKKNERDED